ncbi:MAG: hypothetical protein ACODAU_11240 [Myxococcota bacterium]
MEPGRPSRRVGTGAALAAVAVAWLVPSLAAAAAPAGEADGRDIGAAVLLLLGVGAAYVLAHLVAERLQRRFLVMPGLEYVVLGALLGGELVPGLQVLDELGPLMPFIALAAGWVGLLRGTELDLRTMGDAPAGAARVALVHHLAAGAAVGGMAYFALRSGWVPQVDARGAAIAGWVLGTCAAADSAAPVDLLKRRYGLDGGLPKLLRRSACLGDLLVIFAFGLMFCVFHQDYPGAALELRATEWAVLSVGLGMALGLLFSPFLGFDESANGRFLALVGITTFAAGAAWFLRLDPLLVNMAVGVTMVNTARRGPRIRESLQRTERPQALVLLVLAGALWTPPETWEAARLTLIGIGLFVAVRLAGKVIGSWLAALGTPLRPDLFRGLLGHGEVTVAMAISFRLVYFGPEVDMAYTIVIASVLLHDLIAPRLLRSLLVDAGDITREPQGGAEPSGAS